MIDDVERHRRILAESRLVTLVLGWHDDRHMQDFFYGRFTYDGRGPA
jgi:hypothetical protein